MSRVYESWDANLRALAAVGETGSGEVRHLEGGVGSDGHGAGEGEDSGGELHLEGWLVECWW